MNKHQPIAPLSLVLFAAVWILIIYAVNSIIAGQLKRAQWQQLLVYATTVAMIGICGEIFLDTVYKFFVGRPLWYYNILPIHGGYTSSYAIIIWALYGYHLYLLHGSLAAKWSITRTRHLALIFSLEALLLEALLTISARLFLGRYMYYYLPGDLWHVSSLQNMPFYFLCGVLILKCLKRFRRDPIFFAVITSWVTLVVAFMAR